MDLLETLKQQIRDNPVIIYMKGTPELPMCGFSQRAAQAMMDTGVEFAYVNVLQNPRIMEELPKVADWPTFPQIYIDGELVGGCDIVLELHAQGELKPMMEQAVAKAKEAKEKEQAGDDASSS